MAEIFLFDEILSENVSVNDNYSQIQKDIRNLTSVDDISDERFVDFFRITKRMFEEILDDIHDDLISSEKNKSLDPPRKLAITLRFYAVGSYQACIGNELLLAASQSTVSRVIAEVTPILQNRLCSKWIMWPASTREKQKLKHKFWTKFGFPGVMGAVDGTHVQIISPIVAENVYVNRKGNHSINVQLICDADMCILSVDATHPGSAHDAGIWNLCPEQDDLKRCWQNGEQNAILGDSAYPLQPWLLTPFRSVQINTPQATYNDKHKSVRSVIERCNGVLKMRFRCILSERVLRYQPEKVSNIINVCCALHNMCIYNRLPDPELPQLSLEPINSQSENVSVEISNQNMRQIRRIAMEIRESIMNQICLNNL